MGLYDGKSGPNLNFKFDFDWKKMKYPVLGVLAAAALLAMVLLIMLAVAPKPLDAFLEPNPLDISLGREKVSYLTVTVNNVTAETANDVVVLVETEASDAIHISPKSRNIPTLGRAESRTLSPFAVSPMPGSEVYTGTYFFKVSAEINGQAFEKQVALELKAV